MKVGLRSSNATWLVGMGVAGLLKIPHTPANAASSVLPPAHAIQVIEEAAADGETREIERFWFSEADVINVVVRIGGRPHEFKISGAAELLWVGEPGAIAPPAPVVPATLSEITFDQLPEAARNRILTIVPDFEAVAIEIVPARIPYYRLTGETSRGLVYLSIKASGALMAFDVDADRDGLGDAFELSHGWDPESPDTDADGFPDGIEFEHALGDPGNAAEQPPLLSVQHDREEGMLFATLSTFEGAAFYLEYPSPDGEGWRRLGQTILGDGADHQIAIPLGGDAPLSGLIRAGIADPEEGIDTGESNPDTGEPCSVPDSLVGRQLVVGGGSRLCFKSASRGEEIIGTGGGMLVTPFGYTFRRAGSCTARLTVNFNTATGIQTTVYTLTFGADGSTTGAFARASFSDGGGGDSTNGIFTLN